MMLRVAFFSAFFLYPFVTLSQHQDSLIYWLDNSSVELTIEPLINIQVLPEDVFSGKRIVLAGEATHGTLEFAQIKFELFKYLVEKFDFSYFLVEADFAKSLAINEYVGGGNGDPKQLLSELGYFHIANSEGLRLVQWMHQYNSDKKEKDKIQFYGIDCQESTTALAMLKEFFLNTNSEFYRQIKNVDLLEPTLKYGAKTVDLDTINIIQSELKTNKQIYWHNSSIDEWNLMVKLADILYQSHQINNGPIGYLSREKFSAANIDWILTSSIRNKKKVKTKFSKAMIWAHNAHVNYTVITNAATGKTGNSLGSHLKKKYKNQVYSIGFDFNQGSFYAKEILADTIVGKVFTVPEAPATTFSYLLSRIAKPALFIDFNGIRNESLRTYLTTTKVKCRDVSAVFSDSYPLGRQFRNYLLPERFDGFIFVDSTHPLYPLN
ncbi:MAG: erythromycin esterase family protein [Cyclobacteriaceae bacterium]